MTVYPVFGEIRQRISLNIESFGEKEAARWSVQHIHGEIRRWGGVRKKPDSRMVYVSCHWRNKAAG